MVVDEFFVEDRPWFRFYEDSVPHQYPASHPLFGDDGRGPATSLPEQFSRSVKLYPDNTAIIFEGTRISYSQLNQLVERFAAALLGLGIGRGDKVVIQLPNIPQAIIGFYGTLRIGAVAVMANPMYVPRELEHTFVDSEAKAVLTLDVYWVNKIKGIKASTGLQSVIVTSIADYLPFPKKQLFPLVMKRKGLWAKVADEPGVYHFSQLLANDNGNALADITYAATSSDETACLQYTGGTTGTSKGAILTHANLLANVHQIGVWFPGLRPGKESTISVLPLFHVFGLSVCMNVSIALGATQILIPDPRNLKSIINAIEKYRPTLFPAVPTLFEGINRFKGIEKRDLSSIMGCFSGSAPLPLEVMTQFEKLTGARITEGFGLTEASPVALVNPLFGVRKEGSVGVPFSGTDAKIVDLAEGTTELPDMEPGELIIRGPQVMKGYWKHDEETATTIRNGWLFTGDIAYRDSDGFFFISGRKKELIIAGGYNIYPREIDEVLYAHPDILEAASVGIPDPHRGETVWAFVVPRPGVTLSREDVVKWCEEHLARYKIPRRVEFVTELPRSAVGKILRRELREQAIAGMTSGKSGEKT